MRVVLYSEDLLILSQWEEKITQYQCEILEDIDSLNNFENVILVLDLTSCYKNIISITTQATKKDIKILLLDNTPSFEKGKNLLSCGVKGYGNILMSALYLNSAIETIQNNLIWIYPEFTTSLIESFNKTETVPNELKVKLTKQELKIVSLIKDGYKNIEISESLDISINTVKSHIKNIYEKLNVKNRLSLSLLFQK